MIDSSTLSDRNTQAPLSLVKIFVWVAVGVAIGATGFLGVHLSTKDGNLNNTDIVPQSSDAASSESSHELGLGTKNNSGADLNDPALDVDTIQRFKTVYSYVESVPDQNLVETLNRTINDNWIQSSRVRSALQTALLERQVLVAPATALKFALAQRNPIRSKMVKTVFGEWASTDLETSLEEIANLAEPLRVVALEGVIEFRKELPLSRVREIGLELNLESHAVSHYIESLNTEYLEDPKSRWYELIAIPEAETNLGYVLASQIAQLWYLQEGIDVLQEILNSDAGDYFQRDSINLVLELITREDPIRAFQFAQDIPQEGAFQMFPPTFRVVFVWAEMDPRAALEAVKVVEPSGMRERLQNTAVNSWASANPRELLANLETIPKSTQMSAVSRSFSSLAQSSPNEASELVLQLEDAEMRSRAAESLVYQWAQDNVNATLDWVLEYPETEPNRGRLLESVLSMMVDSDPKRAIQIAAQQPIQEGRNIGLEAQLLSALAFRDVDTAIELLPEARDGETTTAVTRSIGVSLVANGEPERALSLVQQLPDDARDSFYRSISYEWAKFDPTAVLAALKDFPTAELRSNVASELSRMHVQNFSDSQLETLNQYIIEEERQTREE
ncbi:MAG: hypothetical protein F4W92_10300 [Gammaproteobacteria bacterium]|nr:hypothetical protein [Gammaproteobacteria bacterium]